MPAGKMSVVGSGLYGVHAAAGEGVAGHLCCGVEVIVGAVPIGERVLNGIVGVFPRAACLAYRGGGRGGVVGERGELGAAEAARDVAAKASARAIRGGGQRKLHAIVLLGVRGPP